MLGRPSDLRINELEVERDRNPARNFVLEREHIARIAVEPLCPQMHIGLGIDQLGTDADLVARSPATASEYIAYAQLTTNLLGVDRLVAIGERGVARDYQHVREPRQIHCQIFGDAVREILLLGVAAEVRKGQDDDR